MESQELLHPENSEIQNNEVNLEASNETQTVNETATPESAVEPETAEPVTEPVEETVAEPQPEASAEEPQEEPATEPVAEEPAAEPVAEEQPAEEAKAQEPEKPEETLEQVEAEYANFDLAMLVAELEKLVAEPNFNIIKQRVGVIRAKALEFLRERRRARQAEFEAAKTAAAEAAAAAAENLEEGQEAPAVPEITLEPDELETRFNAAFQTFKDNKAAFIEELEQQKQKNLESKTNIIEGLKRLLETETNLKVLNDHVKAFQEQWKAIGPVPQSESTNLWQNYHFYIEKFFDIVRMNREMRMLDYKKNLESKLLLCEKAESLLLEESSHSMSCRNFTVSGKRSDPFRTTRKRRFGSASRPHPTKSTSAAASITTNSSPRSRTTTTPRWCSASRPRRLWPSPSSRSPSTTPSATN